MKIDKSELYKNFINIKNIANINLLICYKILFTIEGLLNNYGCFCLVVVILVHFIIIIIFYAKNLIKKISFIISEIAFGIKNFHLLQIDDINRKNTKKINKQENKSKKRNKKQISKFTSKKNNNIKILISIEEKNIYKIIIIL